VRRRAFLRSVAVAGAAIGFGRERNARAAPAPSLASTYRKAQVDGKPLILTVLSDPATWQAGNVIESGEQQILRGPDRELAIRLWLVDRYAIPDKAGIGSLTGRRSKVFPPSLAFIDGSPPRLIKELAVTMERYREGVRRLLLDLVPLTPAWLDHRIAQLSQGRRADLQRLRAILAKGDPILPLGRELPAVVVREALRRGGPEQERLLNELYAGPPARKRTPDDMPRDDCHGPSAPLNWK
jgi:hypothetical protein